MIELSASQIEKRSDLSMWTGKVTNVFMVYSLPVVHIISIQVIK